MHRNQSVQVVLQEVDPYVEAVVEAVVEVGALRVVRQEVEEALVIEHEGEGVLGGEEEEQVSVLGEGIEGAILISPGLALVGVDHSLLGLVLRQKAFSARENTQNEVRPIQDPQLNRVGGLHTQLLYRQKSALSKVQLEPDILKCQCTPISPA